MITYGSLYLHVAIILLSGRGLAINSGPTHTGYIYTCSHLECVMITLWQELLCSWKIWWGIKLAVWRSIFAVAKFNSCQYFQLYGI